MAPGTVAVSLIAMAFQGAPDRVPTYTVRDNKGRSYALALPGRFNPIGHGNGEGDYAYADKNADSLEVYLTSGDKRAFDLAAHAAGTIEKPFGGFSDRGFQVKVTTWRIDPAELRKKRPWPAQAFAKHPYTRGNARILSAVRHNLVAMFSYQGSMPTADAGRLLSQVSRRFVALNSRTP